jgi:hypothetical protein
MLAKAEARADSDDGGRALRDAKDFLKSELSNGPKPAKKIRLEARDAGISEATLRRARKALKIVVSKQGYGGGWVWSLPVATVEDAHLSEHEHLEHLHYKSKTYQNEHLRDVPNIDKEMSTFENAHRSHEGAHFPPEDAHPLNEDAHPRKPLIYNEGAHVEPEDAHLPRCGHGDEVAAQAGEWVIDI